MRRAHFHALDREQQVQAIRRLAATGLSPDGISHATGLATEMVLHLLEGQGKPVGDSSHPARTEG